MGLVVGTERKTIDTKINERKMSSLKKLKVCVWERERERERDLIF